MKVVKEIIYHNGWSCRNMLTSPYAKWYHTTEIPFTDTIQANRSIYQLLNTIGNEMRSMIKPIRVFRMEYQSNFLNLDSFFYDNPKFKSVIIQAKGDELKNLHSVVEQGVKQLNISIENSILYYMVFDAAGLIYVPNKRKEDGSIWHPVIRSNNGECWQMFEITVYVDVPDHKPDFYDYPRLEFELEIEVYSDVWFRNNENGKKQPEMAYLNGQRLRNMFKSLKNKCNFIEHFAEDSKRNHSLKGEFDELGPLMP